MIRVEKLAFEIINSPLNINLSIPIAFSPSYPTITSSNQLFMGWCKQRTAECLWSLAFHMRSGTINHLISFTVKIQLSAAFGDPILDAKCLWESGSSEEFQVLRRGIKESSQTSQLGCSYWLKGLFEGTRKLLKKTPNKHVFKESNHILQSLLQKKKLCTLWVSVCFS